MAVVAGTGVLALLVTLPALAGGLRFDPEREPILVAELPALGAGAVRIRFDDPREVELPALGAAVLVLHAGVEVPEALSREGTPLGRSGRSWRVPVRPGESAIDVTRRWADHPAVASAVPDLLLPREGRTFDDPRYRSQWYMKHLGMDALFERSLGDPSVRVAVIDSGIEITHVDLAAGFDAPYDAFSDDDDPSPDPGAFCGDGSRRVCDSHGTSVAGIVGARANNGEGIVGFCPSCRMIPIKLLGEGAGALSRDLRAFEHAIDEGAHVINNSWGYTESIPVPEPLRLVIERAATEGGDGRGALVIFAAGNDNREIASDELQALPTVLCVSATDSYGRPTNYTNWGRSVDLAAPSATFTTTTGDGYTETFGGTSAAAPVVAGLAGWALSVAPELDAAALHELFVTTAVPSPRGAPDAKGHDVFYGFGELSALAILDALSQDVDEPRGGCACGHAGGAGAPLGLLLAALAAFRSRRSGARSRS